MEVGSFEVVAASRPKQTLFPAEIEAGKTEKVLQLQKSIFATIQPFQATHSFVPSGHAELARALEAAPTRDGRVQTVYGHSVRIQIEMPFLPEVAIFNHKTNSLDAVP